MSLNRRYPLLFDPVVSPQHSIIAHQHQGRKYTRGGRVSCIIRICIVFCIVFVFLAPATRDHCGGRKRDGASCLGCTLGTWLCSMSSSIIYHVSCYRFVSQHTHIYHIGPHTHVDTDSDSRQQQQQQPPAPAPAPAVAQIIQNNTKSSLLYDVLYVLIVLCIVLCIMYFRSLTSTSHASTPHTQASTHSTQRAQTKDPAAKRAALRSPTESRLQSQTTKPPVHKQRARINSRFDDHPL
jgi:hypothetical protein